MVFGLTTMRAFAPRDLAAYPNILAYLKRIGERPAYQRAMPRATRDGADAELASERRPTLTLHPRSGWRDE